MANEWNLLNTAQALRRFAIKISNLELHAIVSSGFCCTSPRYSTEGNHNGETVDGAHSERSRTTGSEGAAKRQIRTPGEIVIPHLNPR
jgi:hypothetical protein